MTVVTMPDGVPVDFGDMPPDQIKTLIQKKFPDFGKPPPETPWYGDEPGIAAKVLQGFGSIATGIDDVMSGRVDPKSDEGIGNIADAAMIATPVSAASRGGLGWAGAPVKKTPVKPAIPTAGELTGTGGFGYKMAREMDVRYKRDVVQNMAMKLQSQLSKDMFRDREHSAPGTFHELRGLLKPAEPGAFASIDDLHSTRQALQEIAKNPNTPTDAKAATIVIKAIDDFISNPDPKAVVAGPAAAAGGVWKDANANYAAGKRSNDFAGLEDNAELQAIATNSGLNSDNKLRQMAALIVRKPELRAGFSTEEIGMLRNVAGEGAKARNALRWWANVLGGGGGLGAFVTGAGSTLYTGATMPAIVGTAAIGTGLAAKVAANKITKRELGKVDQATRKRSPLYEQRLETAPMVAAPPALRSIPGRAAVPMVRNGRSYGPAPEPQMTPGEFEQYLRQKYARDQGV